LIETSSAERGRHVGQKNEGIMTFLKTPEILCANQVAGEGWRDESVEGKNTKKELLSTI
jgi:hypothetical protein